ncbi:hypothetical protein CspHIS471_0602170 [Cutaneotrichosporon sp. HIS471]|nr:hypothetical protein CspHIS471_0602170 [Cutaneotrichosporon sp. HIS471]
MGNSESKNTLAPGRILRPLDLTPRPISSTGLNPKHWQHCGNGRDEWLCPAAHAICSDRGCCTTNSVFCKVYYAEDTPYLTGKHLTPHQQAGEQDKPNQQGHEIPRRIQLKDPPLDITTSRSFLKP